MNISPVGYRVFRGCAPQKAQDFIQLQRLGIKTILDLQGDLIELLSNDLAKEIDACDFKIRAQPMSGVWRPSKQQLINAVAYIQNEEGPVFVHCQHGVDRTGMVIAAWRMIVGGWSLEAATAEMENMGMHWIYRILWAPGLKEFA